MSRSTTDPSQNPVPEAYDCDLSSLPGEDEAGGYIPGTIDAYRVLKVLGRGGMGRVYLGIDPYGNKVAIKAFDPLMWPSATDRKRFVREARALSVLQHPNICRIYGVKSVRGTPHIVMEHVQGVNLDRLLKAEIDFSSLTGKTAKEATQSDISKLIEAVELAEETSRDVGVRKTPGKNTPMQILPQQQALAIAIKLCRAVQYAHERGIMHRDIKPSNVIIRRDGEPILLDFGVAKMVNEPGDENLTMTGEFFGTLESMAPEQAQSSGEIDERADVYSIGAILYRLITGRKHFVSGGHVLRDIEKLRDFDPVAPRTYNKTIDRDLQAIVLKALNPDPNRRYRSALLLGEDLERYQRGQPITARRFTMFSRIRKLIRRHKIPVTLSSLLFGLVISFAGYFAYDYYSQWGEWILAYECDFAAGKYNMNEFQFIGTDLKPAPNWEVDSAGLIVREHETLWLKNVKVYGDIRLVVRMSYRQFPDGFEMIVNAADDSLSTYFQVPRSYSCQFGGYSGTMDFVSVNRLPGISGIETAVASSAERGAEYELTLERDDRDVTLYVDGSRQTADKDYLPFWGPQFCRVGMRSYAVNARIKSIEVYHLSLPRKTGPLIAGDALAISGHTRDAISMYLGIADDYSGTDLGEEAMARSCFVAYQSGENVGQALVDSIMTVFESRYPQSSHRRRLRELQLMDLWRNHEYDSVLNRLPAMLGEYPESDVVFKLKKLGLTPGSGSADSLLFPFLVRNQNLRSLDLPSYGLSDLSVLKDLSLIRLNVEGNHLTSLEELSSMKLGWLNCSRNSIPSLEPLAGMPLTYLQCNENGITRLDGLSSPRLRTLRAVKNRINSLEGLLSRELTVLDISDNQISSLEPLRGKNVSDLRVEDNQISSLEPLTGMALRALTVSYNAVSDLSALQSAAMLEEFIADHNLIQDLTPLKGMPLRVLRVRHNVIRDLGPLRGMPLQILKISNNRVSSLEPLQGMPLLSLDARNCPVRDLEPVRGMKIEELHFNGSEIKELSPLEGMPLRILQAGYSAIASLEPLRKAPLSYLSVPQTRIRSLEPLRGLPLHYLDIRHNGVETLEPVFEAPLHSLHCGGNDGIPSEELGEFRDLRELACDLMGLTNLDFVENMEHLTALSIKDNRLSDLGPLKSRKLTRVLMSRNNITSLEPLREVVELRELAFSNNQVESLDPIRDLDLNWLVCEHNNITSLEPYYRRPPQTFYFYSNSLSSEELLRAASHWDRDPRSAYHARNARVMAAVRDRRYDDLKKLGFRKNGIVSVLIPICMDYHNAEAFADSIGASLLPLEDPRMFDHLRRHGGAAHGVWINETVYLPVLHGALDDEMTPRRYAEKLTLRKGEVWHENNVDYFSTVHRDPFIVVWEE